MTTIADFTATTLRGDEQPLAAYQGKVVLVVNTASRCGLTPQFEGLEALHRELGPEGLVILGFPCNQFAGQEPLDDHAIGEFCQANYGVTFPMFGKIDVNGPDEHPLYGWLKASTSSLMGDAVKWNFTKFLVGRDGRAIRRYAPTTEPEKLTEDIRAALAA